MPESIFKMPPLSPEICFLIAAAKENPGAARSILNAAPGVDFAKLMELVRQNGLPGFFYASLKKTGLMPECPPSVQTDLKSAYLVQWSRAEQKLAQMKEIKALLNGNEIGVIFLKGLVTAEAFYGHIAQRLSIDLDCLVKQKDLRKVEELFAEQKFSKHGAFFPSRGFATHWALHHLVYSTAAGIVEVHWKLHNFPFFKIKEAGLWQGRESLRIQDEDFYRLTDEYELLLQLFSQMNTWSYRRAFDIYLILKKMEGRTDWEAFFEKRRRDKTFGFCLNLLWLSLSMTESLEDFPEIKTVLEKNRRRLLPFRELTFHEEGLCFVCNDPMRNTLLKLKLYRNPALSLPWWLLTAHSRKKGCHG